MAQFEYQLVEQAGGRASHLTERLMQLTNEGWEPIMMTGTAPQVTLLVRRPLTAKSAAPAPPAGAAPAPAPGAAQPVAPRPAAPTQPGVPPRPATPQ